MPGLIFILLLSCVPFSVHSQTLDQTDHVISLQHAARNTRIGLTFLPKIAYQEKGPEKQKELKTLHLAQTPHQQAPAITPLGNKRLHDINSDKPEISIRQQEQQIIQTISDWARAWSNKDIKHYINAYTRYYRGRKSNHRDWVKHINNRFQQAGKIDVSISNIHIKSRNAQRVLIDFEQAYKSPTYRDKIIKRIILTKQDNDWKISEERTVSVLYP